MTENKKVETGITDPYYQKEASWKVWSSPLTYRIHKAGPEDPEFKASLYCILPKVGNIVHWQNTCLAYPGFYIYLSSSKQANSKQRNQGNSLEADVRGRVVIG